MDSYNPPDCGKDAKKSKEQTTLFGKPLYPHSIEYLQGELYLSDEIIDFLLWLFRIFLPPKDIKEHIWICGSQVYTNIWKKALE